MPLKDTFKPPSNWKTLYDRVSQYRKVNVAPVDTIGCHCLLDRQAPKQTQRFHTLIALMLSSQTKDQVTALAMETLIQKGLTPQSVSKMSPQEFDACISKVGFHNMKTKYIKETADILLRDYNGNVPTRYEDVIALPGVGPKMAHLFFQSADNVILGIGVDTHVHRISQRFGWAPTTVKNPEDTRKTLEAWLPREYWGEINMLLVGLGQTICAPVNPQCGDCKLNDICPNAFKEAKQAKKLVKTLDIEDTAGRRKTSPARKKKKV